MRKKKYRAEKRLTIFWQQTSESVVHLKFEESGFLVYPEWESPPAHEGATLTDSKACDNVLPFLLHYLESHRRMASAPSGEGLNEIQMVGLCD
jgi:hypothetical protein